MLILCGIIVGFCFDLYRIVRWRLDMNKLLTFIGDLVFSFLALLVIFYVAQKANYLEFRFYLFAATLLGLVIYLRLFSPACKKLFGCLWDLLVSIVKLVIKIIGVFIKSSVRILTSIMSIPYCILCWFSMLLFRMGEALGRESATKVKGRMTKTPRQ